MKVAFRQLLDLFGRRDRLKLAALTVLVVVGSGLEVLGIGIFLPFVSIISDPEAALAHPRFGPLLAAVGVSGRESVILATAGGLLAVFAIKNLYLAAQWLVVDRFVYGKAAAMGTELFHGYLRSPYIFHLRTHSSRLTRNVAVELKHVFVDFLQPAMLLVAEALVTVGLLLVLLVVNPVAAGAGLVVMGALTWVAVRVARQRLSQLGVVRSEEQARRYQWMAQGFGAIKEIHVLGRDRYFRDRFHESEERLMATMRDGHLLAQYPRLGIEMAGVVLLVLLLTLPLLAGQTLQAMLGTLVVFALAVVRLMPAVGRMSSSVNRLRLNARSVAIAHEDWVRIREQKGQEERREAALPIRLRRRLEVQGATYQYPGAPDPAARDVSFTMEQGSCVTLVGPSGSGKTTVLYLILGLLEPGSGQVLVDGRDIREDMASWRGAVGYVPQDAYLLHDTIRRNVAFGVPDEEVDDEAVWKALEMAALAPAVRRLPDGLDALTGERGLSLSGGQRQRLAIARALYHDPDVLVLDEPTSSLDHDTELEVGAALSRLVGRKTVLIVTHRPPRLWRSDRVLTMSDGLLVASEPAGAPVSAWE